jgi:putative phosphoribosyl transferase
VRQTMHIEEVTVPAGRASLPGTLAVPDGARGIVVFVHGSGSSRLSPRNRQVASALNDAGLATLLFDLLTRQESEIDDRTAALRFDIRLLADRCDDAIDWLGQEQATRLMKIGLFGASTGAAGALVTAANRPQDIAAVVSRGGRPDLAGDALARVNAPTLLIVGERDATVAELNRLAARQLRCDHVIEIVPGASHLFEEPGTLERVADLARAWFVNHLGIAR